MKNKKGFTLVELLAVIAILAILVLIAIPNVLNLYRNARKNTFVSDVQSIMRASEQEYVISELDDENNTCYDSKTNPLEIDARSNLNYRVNLNKGKIINIEVLDNNYYINVDNEEGIKRDSITSNEVKTRDNTQTLLDCEGNPIVEGITYGLPLIKFEGSTPDSGYIKEGKLYKEDIKTEIEKLESIPSKEGYIFKGYNIPESETQIIDEEGNIIKDNLSQIEESTTLESKWEEIKSMIKRRDINDIEETYYLNTTLEREKIESVKFVTTKEVPQEVIGSADISDSGKEDIMMWWTDTNSNNLYEVTIGQDGGVNANTDSSYLFSHLTNLTTVDFTNLDTSKVELMICLFSVNKKLSTITFGENFDTSNVTSLHGMFDQCVALKNLDLTSFNTLKVTSMAYLFSFCTGLQTIIFGENFDTSKVTNMYRMFYYLPELQNLDLSSFTIREDANLNCMFYNTTKLDLSTTNLPNYELLKDKITSCTS